MSAAAAGARESKLSRLTSAGWLWLVGRRAGIGRKPARTSLQQQIEKEPRTVWVTSCAGCSGVRVVWAGAPDLLLGANGNEEQWLYGMVVATAPEKPDQV